MRRLPVLPLMFLLPAFLLPGFAPTAAAQEPPGCDAARVGAVACMAGRLCACRFDRGGSLTGLPDGHRWDCGILRPACGEALPPPGPGFVPGWGAAPDLLLMPPRSPWPR